LVGLPSIPFGRGNLGGPRAEPGGEGAVAEEATRGCGKRLSVTVWHDKAGSFMYDEIATTGNVRRHNRASGGHRFEKRIGKTFRTGWQHKHIGRLEQRRNIRPLA